MKRFLYPLLAVAGIFAVAACDKTKEEDKGDLDEVKTVFEIEEIEALPAESGTFSLNITSNVEFLVSIPEDIDWLRYVATKADEAQKKSVEFSIDLNEDDAMRQARISFTNKADGELLKNFTIMQKAGGGIEFEIAEAEDVPVAGADVTLAVTSNVPFTATPEVEWITVKTTTAESVTLTVASNGTAEPRDGKVNFFREGTDKLIGFVSIHQMEPNVILNGSGFTTIEEAMEAYNALTEGNATLTLAKGTHKGVITIAEGKRPLTITGNEVAVLDGTIEIDRVAVTVRDLTIAPSEGNLPQFTTSYNYQHGIFVHAAAYNTVIQNVKIDMKNLASDATGIFLLNEAKGWGRDIVRNCTVDGADGHRLIQAYGAVASLTGNTFKGPYSSYAMRIGNKDNDIILSGNTFEGTAGCAVHFYSLENSTVTLGNGVKDNNKFPGTFDASYKANTDVTAGGNSFFPPVEYNDGVVTVYIDPDAPANLERVWAYYNGEKGAWDDEITDRTNWNRNAVIVGDYVYVTIAGAADGQYGVAVFNLYTGEYVRTITQGFERVGTFYTCGMTKLAGYDGDVIYVSNMTMKTDDDLIVYKLTELDSEGIPTKAEIAMRYSMAAMEGERFGDKMTAYGAGGNNGVVGSEEDARLFFVSFYKPSTWRKSIEFAVTNGEVSNTPVVSPYLGTAAGSTTASIHMIYAQTTSNNATRQALYGSNFDFRYIVTWWWDSVDPDGWYNTAVEDGNGGKATDSNGDIVYSDFTGKGNFDSNANDPILFLIGTERYIAYVTVELDGAGRSYGWLRLVHVPLAPGSYDYHVLGSMYRIMDNDLCFQRYPLGDADDFYATGSEGTNKTGFCDVMQDGENTYIIAGITSTGMSLFKVE